MCRLSVGSEAMHLPESLYGVLSSLELHVHQS